MNKNIQLVLFIILALPGLVLAADATKQWVYEKGDKENAGAQHVITGKDYIGQAFISVEKGHDVYYGFTYVSKKPIVRFDIASIQKSDDSMGYLDNYACKKEKTCLWHQSTTSDDGTKIYKSMIKVKTSWDDIKKIKEAKILRFHYVLQIEEGKYHEKAFGFGLDNYDVVLSKLSTIYKDPLASIAVDGYNKRVIRRYKDELESRLIRNQELFKELARKSNADKDYKNWRYMEKGDRAYIYSARKIDGKFIMPVLDAKRKGSDLYLSLYYVADDPIDGLLAVYNGSRFGTGQIMPRGHGGGLSSGDPCLEIRCTTHSKKVIVRTNGIKTEKYASIVSIPLDSYMHITLNGTEKIDFHVERQTKNIDDDQIISVSTKHMHTAYKKLFDFMSRYTRKK